MSKKISSFATVATAVTLLFSTALTALRIYLMQNAYDFTKGFYTNRGLHLVLRYTLIAIAVIAFVAAYVYIKEDKKEKGVDFPKPFIISTYICTVVFAGFILYTFAKLVLPNLNDPAGTDLLACVFAAIALLYFISFEKCNIKLGDSRSLLCAGTALCLLAIVFGLYFNKNISYVNHSVVLLYATAIFLMLTTVAEANSFIRRPFIKRYLAYAPTAVILSFTLSVSDIVYTLSNKVSPITDVIYDIVILSLGFFHLARLIAVCQAAKVKD